MGISRLRVAFEPLLRRAFHLYWRFTRPMTLGVRGLVRDGEGQVFLVKHSYVAGWHLPGGGVEAGETLATALTRELREEGNIEVTGAPKLFAVYFNPKDSNRDHVALFVVEDFRQASAPVPDREIIDHGFFAPNTLPEGTTRATRARIAEVLDGAAVPERW